MLSSQNILYDITGPLHIKKLDRIILSLNKLQSAAEKATVKKFFVCERTAATTGASSFKVGNKQY